MSKRAAAPVFSAVLAACAGGQATTGPGMAYDAAVEGQAEAAEAGTPSSQPEAAASPTTVEAGSPDALTVAEASTDRAVESDAGAEASTGCPGVPIVPDANGYVAPGSTAVGIHGSFFIYSDCNDLGGKDCADVTSPTGTGAFPNTGGRICTSGTNSTAPNAWGAGVGLELNDGPPQEPYDTTAHGVVGFCFQLSGPTIPSTSVRVAFPTQDNNDNAYFESVSTPGQHTVLFSGIAQGSWVKTASPWEPTKVMLMQFQIPASTATPVAWDFCIEGLTAIVQ